MANKLEAFVIQKMNDIPFAAGKKIVEAPDLMPFRKKPVAKMRADESGSAGDENARKNWEWQMENGELRIPENSQFSTILGVFRRK